MILMSILFLFIFRFLTIGGTFIEYEDIFVIHNTTIGEIIQETIQAIWDTFKPVHMKLPSKEELKASAERFYLETGFPHAPLLLDGKHFPMKNLSGAFNTYHNRKGFFSVNLQGMFSCCIFVYLLIYFDF